MEDIQAQIDGMVTKVFIQAGNHVQEGTVIAEVENVDLPAQIAQAIQKATKIMVLHEGTIVETGNFTELMQKQGLVAQLAKRQLV